ncbi:hypothetical protein [Paenibacillus sp. 79R4]|nr:hypothetical protein [Paenibacillus sp. 79R4]
MPAISDIVEMTESYAGASRRDLLLPFLRLTKLQSVISAKTAANEI